MKTDTEALAAYFKAWREGDPVPRFVDSIGLFEECRDPKQNFTDGRIKEIAEALTGVLVVELANQCPHGAVLHKCEMNEGQWRWYSVGELVGAESFGVTPLCTLVAAWMEIRK